MHKVIQLVKKESKLKFIIIGIVLVTLLGGGLFFQMFFTIRKVEVEGNVHYTSKEIEDMVLESNWHQNSILLSLIYRNKDVNNIPFVEAMDVTILSHDHVKITVYEKALAGCVEYLGRYMYFDREGIVVESDSQTSVGVPQITGLRYGHIIMFEKLPVKDATVFKDILSITQLLNKYEISADKIYFGENKTIILHFDQARVNLGDTQSIDEKIMQLKNIIPELDGKSGVLHMENYTINTKSISFELDEKN